MEADTKAVEITLVEAKEVRAGGMEFSPFTAKYAAQKTKSHRDAPNKKQNEQGQTHSQLGKGDTDGSDVSPNNGVSTIYKIVKKLNSQVNILMSTNQAPIKPAKNRT